MNFHEIPDEELQFQHRQFIQALKNLEELQEESSV